MNVAYFYGKVRIVWDGSPFDVAHDIKVEWKPDNNDEWVLYQGFNSLSDDYANTNAREAAKRALKVLDQV